MQKVSGAFVAPKANTLPVEPPPKLAYVNVTKAAGIDFVHETGAFGQKYLPETMGAGAGFLDYDGDGDPDLVLLNGDWWPGHEKAGPRPTMRLWRNDGGWKFSDVTKEAGLDVTFYAMGLACADVDGDGDTDLFVAGVGGYRFFRNDGGQFVESSREAGLDPGTWKDSAGKEHGPFATSAAFLDYDGDGRPDLFVCHYVHWSVETDVPSMIGQTRSYAIPTQYPGESCRLWRNVGGGRFEDATDAAGVRNDKGKSLGVLVVDLGDDGRPDLVVANDTQPNYVYRNEGGRFTEAGLKCGVAYDRNGRARAGMGIAAAPVLLDGHVAFAIGNFSGEPVSLWEETRPSCFADRADVAGIGLVTTPSLTFGVAFLDADLDGRADLLLANGHIEPTIQETQKEISYAQPTQLLRGLEGGQFADVTKLVGGDLQRPRVARSIAVADVDGDGDLDFCLTTNGGPPALFRCDLEDAAKRSVRVRVHGRAPGTDALGAKVTVTAAGRTQSQWVRSGGGYLGASETTLTFGLGGTERAEKVVVQWPDRSTRTWFAVAPGVLQATPEEEKKPVEPKPPETKPVEVKKEEAKVEPKQEDVASLTEWTDPNYGYRVTRPSGWTFQPKTEWYRIQLVKVNERSMWWTYVGWGVWKPNGGAIKDARSYADWWITEKFPKDEFAEFSSGGEPRFETKTIGSREWVVVTARGLGKDVMKNWGAMERRIYITQIGGQLLYASATVRASAEDADKQALWANVEASCASVPAAEK